MSDVEPEDFSESWALIRRTSPKSYVGRRMKGDKCVVTVVENDQPRALSSMRKIRNHSKSFEWGYAGSGPAQLALALLCDYLGDPAKAQRLYQKFKFMVVVKLPKEGWLLTEDVVKGYVEALEAGENEGNPSKSKQP